MLLWRGVVIVGLSFAIFVTVLFFAEHAEAYSRGALISQIVAVTTTLLSLRVIFFWWHQLAIATDRVEGRRVALVGDASHCSMLAGRLKSCGICTVGSFRFPRSTDKTLIDAITRKLMARIRSLGVDDIVVLVANDVVQSTFDLVSALSELPASIHILPVGASNFFATSRLPEFGIQVYRPPLSTFDLCVKRAFDFAGATIGLVALSPLFAVISVAIKLDSAGPVLFRSTRHGFNNAEIRAFKFRSMTTTENGGQFTQASADDPRTTRIGRILRRTNIDELPQLINVLRGEMSLVGPRPHATAHNALFSTVIAPFSRRHSVKPGITGWAQVNGYRGATDAIEKMQQRIEHDIFYIDNWSFFLDIKIIVMTLFSKKAYLNAY